MKNQSYENVIGKKLQMLRKFFQVSEQDAADYLGIPLLKYQEYESGVQIPKDLPGEFALWLFCPI